jgi:hypothetical protein
MKKTASEEITSTAFQESILLTIFSILEENNRIRRREEEPFLPLLVPLKRNAIIDDMKLIVTAICQKAKDGKFTKQIVLNCFDECIKSFESM